MKVPAPAMAVASMLSVQIGAALSTHLFTALSPAGSAWIRVAVAAVVLLAVTRPRLRSISWPVLRATFLLGAATAVLTLAFIEAVARIPLGTTAAIEFLGPLGVAALRSHRRTALIWPALAMLGVIGLTEPWRGQLNVVGVGFAVTAAVGWGIYILLTQWVGAELEGLQGLALSLATATVVAAPVAAWPAIRGMTPLIALAAIGTAVLVPLLPFSLEMLALRRMGAAAFGTLMALEPGIAAIIGLLLLSQHPAIWQVAGIVLVVAAGVGAQRSDPGVAAALPGADPQTDPAAFVEPPAGPVAPRLLFERVPEAMAVKHRVHLDPQPDTRRDEEVARLQGHGAGFVPDFSRADGTGWIVLSDPEGNEFCVERSQAERDA